MYFKIVNLLLIYYMFLETATAVHRPRLIQNAKSMPMLHFPILIAAPSMTVRLVFN
jgi:hypothetical protein